MLIIDASKLSLCLDLLCTFFMLNIISSKALGYETIARFLLSGRKIEFTPSHFRIKDTDIATVKKLCRGIQNTVTGYIA